MKPGTKAWKNFMSKLYGIGAAIVIIGALFKIQHWPFAGLMLTVGLGTEAVIFFFSAFEPIHEDYDWTLVYPELALGHDSDDDEITSLTSRNNGTVTQQLDGMLEEAKIDGALIESLGDGMRNLSETANKISTMSDATAVSADYTNSLKNAASKVDGLADSYTKASESLMGLTNATGAGESFGEEMQKVAGNLTALNKVYEMQLEGATESLENSKKIQSGIGEMMGTLADSVEDTKNYKTNIAELSKNLSALNKVYGNMLNAMNINPNG
ncbi:gliding motility protein GldL [bacterium]|nr:gliding motility protein GldL [bacterium]MDB4089436.1 gliding motility protein GldL [Flavobacteriales bacterium]